jgi:hypothetical protein
VILQAEASCRTYQQLRDLFGKQHIFLTQIDVNNPVSNTQSQPFTITSRVDIEDHILCLNRRHSLQALATPFMSSPTLHQATLPSHPQLMDKLLDGSFLQSTYNDNALNENERQWILSLKRLINSEIPLSITINNFKHFFQKKTRKNIIITIWPSYGPLQIHAHLYQQ